MNVIYRVITLLALMLAGGPAVRADSQRLSLTGSSTIAPLALEIAKRYEQQHPGVRIDVQTGGSTRGIIDVRRGLADIGMVSRRLNTAEQDLTAYTIAQDGISLIVHATNPVTSLSDQQIIRIYRGEITNWSALGGPDKAITVVNKAEGRSTLALFLDYFKLKNSQIKAQVIIGDNQQAIKTVARNAGAIAYVSIGTAEYEQSVGTAIKRLPMSGIDAATLTVRQGSYPLSRELNLVIRGRQNALAQDFIHYARSPAVHDLIEAQYFVPVSD
jgi:phosphate transport system substrate-binding protein